MTEGGLGEGAKGGGLFSRLPSCLRRDRNEMRYQSLTVSEGENGDHLSSGWNAVLMPLLWRFKSQRTKLSKHAILQMELQAMGAGKHEQDKTLIHPSSQFSQIWKVIMAITVVCSVIEVPFIACFTPLDDDGIINRPDEYFHIGYRTVVDCIFVADIFVNFRTGYHKLGAVVMNKELIEHHYLRHGFVLDLIAALPILVLPVTIIFSIMCSHGACPNAWAMYLLRYVRLLQLAKVKSAMTQVNLMLEVLSDQTNTMATRLVQLLLWFIVLTHWFTCIWFLAQVHPINFQVHGEEEEYKLDLKDSWLANASPDDPAIPFCVQSFMDGAASFRETMILYINCFYWASSANDAYTTQNTSEKFIAILAQIVVENGFMALILASIISSLEEHSRSQKKHTIYRSKIDAVNDFMREEKFPPSVVDDVRHYYKVRNLGSRTFFGFPDDADTTLLTPSVPLPVRLAPPADRLHGDQPSRGAPVVPQDRGHVHHHEEGSVDLGLHDQVLCKQYWCGRKARRGRTGHLQQDRLDQPDLGDAHSKVPHRAAVPDAPGRHRHRVVHHQAGQGGH